MQRMVEGQQNGQQRVLPSCNLSLFFRFLCSHYHATIAAGLAAVHILRVGLSGGSLTMSKKETIWLERMERELNAMPTEESQLLDEMKQLHAGVFAPASYGLD